MSQQELLTLLVHTLERLQIGYFITGSWSSSVQGEPRSTHDLDVVVALAAEQIEALLAAFPRDRFYVDERAVRDAVQRGSMFNLLDTTGGDKIDFWLLTDDPWDESRFGRRIRVPVFGVEACFSSPEDTILAKLRWANLSGGSQKQLSDARGVCEVQAGALDIDYIETWSRRLGVNALWDEIREAGEQ